MSLLIYVTIGAITASALTAPDPVAECRAAHGDDIAAYAGCLEDALRAADGGAADQVAATPADTGIGASEDKPGKERSGRGKTDEDAAVRNGPGGLGAEQIRKSGAEADELEEVQVRIVEVSYDSADLGSFRTEDGQLWRETSRSPTRRQLEPGRQYDARIVRGKLGGYRMHVEGVRWMKTVRRLE